MNLGIYWFIDLPIIYQITDQFSQVIAVEGSIEEVNSYQAYNHILRRGLFLYFFGSLEKSGYAVKRKKKGV